MPKHKPDAAVRDRERPLLVYVSDAERAEIDRLAGAANRSRSDFLRSAALGADLRHRAGADAALALAEANAGLERVGASLGRWLAALPARAGEGAAADEARRLLDGLPGIRHRLAAAAEEGIQ